VSRAIADTSIFIAREAGRPLGELPDEIAVSVVTAAELELGVLRALDAAVRAVRLQTLSRVRAEYRRCRSTIRRGRALHGSPMKSSAPAESSADMTSGSPRPRCVTEPPS
jgi:predicted nucleic acid-binding protein